MNRKSIVLPELLSNLRHLFIIPGQYIMKSTLKCLPVFLFLILVIPEALSQIPFTDTEIGSEYNRGMELYGKEKYPAAIALLDSYRKNNNDHNALQISEAEYFSAISALKLFNSDGEYRMVNYMAKYPDSPHLNEARLSLGDYFYQNKNYRKAVKYYKSANRQDLQGGKLAEYFFRLGYSLYTTGDKPGALLMFSEIKDIDTEYTSPAIYYFSQVAYEQKMYETALEGFTRLKDDETFGGIVPFYIVQILYLKKDYDGILTIAPDLVNKAGKERAVELYRFIGDAWYNKGNYKEALPYLEKYAEGAKASDRENKYQLGYSYYKTGDIDKAIKIFLEIGSRSDLVSQNIWNVLGDCYIQKGDKKRAQLAFGEASKMDFDKGIKEEALFNYAKLTYETSYSPFGEAIAAFQEYINLYPGSPRVQEVYEYLVATYTQLKNYKAALASLDKIQKKDSRLEEAYQKVAFFRGLELFKNLEFENSIDMFEKSLRYEKYNRSVRARTIYWRGEGFYRLGLYDKAREDYELFIGIPGARTLDEYNLVRYNLGYAYFNAGDYSSAQDNFQNFEQGAANIKSDVIADAWNRIGDCYYIDRNYQQAISYYDKVIDYGATDADYAMFQKGFSIGLMSDQKAKVNVLSALILKYPSSAYVPQAIFERGRAYVVLGDHSKGEVDFNNIISNYPTSPFVPRAILQMGLLYYDLGENDKAIAQFKKVIEGYKSTPESRYAMTGLRNAYVDNNDVDSYFSYVKSLDGYADINLSEKDSLLYTSGENLYIKGTYDKAADVFSNYLKEFPNGSFKQNAQYYLAESLRTKGETEEALKLYIDISSQPTSQFYEQALIAAGTLLYQKEDYETSLGYFEKLEKLLTNDENRLISLRGQLRSAYQVDDADKTIAAADKINSLKKVPEELTREATFMSAKANYSLKKFDEALAGFRKVAKEVTSVEGAESKYRVAEILYKKDQMEESEKIITEFIDQNSPHQYWMARIFLLLADISMKKGDILQAQATLQSLKDYYTVQDDGILDEVRARQDILQKGN